MTDDEGIVYRGVYGEAARLVEAAKYDHSWGRDFARRVVPDRAELIAAASRRGRSRELVELAVDDVLEGRRPRW